MNCPVLIVLGSQSDLERIKAATETLEEFGVEYELVIASAHRNPKKVEQLSSEAKGKGVKVIIAAAGLAAHLPGVIAAYTTLPVIGLPLAAGALNGIDSLYSIVQMPPGVPVGCMAINGAKNAALYALQIIALSDAGLAEKLKIYKESLQQ